MFRENLSSLDSYVSTVNYDLARINQYVKLNYEGLKARGERCDDIMSNLFKGYLCINDKEFVSYIKLKKNDYKDGQDMSADQLMQLALNKYEILTKKDLWQKPPSEEAQITALSAELKSLKDSNLKLSKSVKNAAKKSNESSSSNKDTKSKDKKKDNKKKKGLREKDKWKLVPPTDGQNTKMVKDKKFHWCPYHNMWTVHDPEDKGPNGCKLRKEIESGKGKSETKSLYKKAFAAIFNNMDDDDESE